MGEQASKIHKLETPMSYSLSRRLGICLFPTHLNMCCWDALLTWGWACEELICIYSLRHELKTYTKPSYTSIYPFFRGWKKNESIHMDLGVQLEMFSFFFLFLFFFLFGGKNKSNTLSTLIGRKFCLLGNFVKENLRSRRTHEEHCFFSSKCFHSLNKFNKTSFDWQESALPQCLLFAITFLVSSCVPFLNEMKTGNLRSTHTLWAWNKWDFYTSLRWGFNVLLMTHFRRCYSASFGVFVGSAVALYKRQSHHGRCCQMACLKSVTAPFEISLNVTHLPSFERFLPSCSWRMLRCTGSDAFYISCMFVCDKKELVCMSSDS